MEKSKTIQHKRGNSKLTDAKTNEDFNNQKPHAEDPNLLAYDPTTEVPLIGDDDKEITEDITMNKTKGKDMVKPKRLPASPERIKERDAESKSEDSRP